MAIPTPTLISQASTRVFAAQFLSSCVARFGTTMEDGLYAMNWNQSGLDFAKIDHGGVGRGECVYWVGCVGQPLAAGWV